MASLCNWLRSCCKCPSAEAEVEFSIDTYSSGNQHTPLNEIGDLALPYFREASGLGTFQEILPIGVSITDPEQESFVAGEVFSRIITGEDPLEESVEMTEEIKEPETEIEEEQEAISPEDEPEEDTVEKRKLVDVS